MSLVDLQIKSFIDPDNDRLLELGQIEYEGREISQNDYLRWEYAMNPDGQAIISVAEDAGIIAGQYVVIPRYFSIGGHKVKGSLSVNTLTHPAYRGRGLFPQLAAETFRKCQDLGVHFTIGFPNPVSSPVISRKKIFQAIGTLPLLVKPLNPVRSVFKYLTGKKEKSGSEIQLDPPEGMRGESGVSAFDFLNDADGYESFFGQFNAFHKNVTYRSLAFLRWRYKNIPLRDYRILKLTDRKRIIALAVFRAKHVYGIRCGILVDFMYTAEANGAAQLLKAIQVMALGKRLDLLITTVPAHTPEFTVLKQAGYRPVPDFILRQPLSVIYRQHTPAVPESAGDFRKWFLTFGDYDIF